MKLNTMFFVAPMFSSAGNMDALRSLLSSVTQMMCPSEAFIQGSNGAEQKLSVAETSFVILNIHWRIYEVRSNAHRHVVVVCRLG